MYVLTLNSKTVAMGIPLLQAMFDGDENLGMYCLPLLIWHPAQLLIGSWAAPHIRAWLGESTSGAVPETAEEAGAAAAGGAGGGGAAGAVPAASLGEIGKQQQVAETCLDEDDGLEVVSVVVVSSLHAAEPSSNGDDRSASVDRPVDGGIIAVETESPHNDNDKWAMAIFGSP